MIEEQDKDLETIFKLLEKHIMDNFEDVKKLYVYWQCYELCRKYYEGKFLY